MPRLSNNGREGLSFDVEGFKELERKLTSLIGHGLTNPELLAMYKSAARPMRDRMKALTPSDTGQLVKTISVRRAKKNRNDGAAYVIGPRGGRRGAPHAHLVNLGTKAGLRRSRENKFGVPAGGDIIRTQVIEHPGSRGVFFVQKAFKQKAGEVAKSMSKKFDAYIRKKMNS